MTSNSNQLYLPGLNGIRAVAALAVLFGHMWAPFGNWGVSPNWHIPWPNGPVTTFFVISGFLITFLLLNETAKTNDINIPKFYMRRILRIWPLYYAYLLFALLAVRILGDEINSAVWFYTFFSGNISHALAIGIIPLYHFWSLGVEEQYYLWYPWMVKYNKKNLLTIVSILFLSWFVLKLATYAFLGKGLVYRILSITQFDCMMLGAIGAIMYYRKTEWFNRFCSHPIVAVSAWILFFTSGLYANIIPSPIRNEFIALISLLVIVAGLLHKPLLENKMMNYLGQISYGIYVIHPLLLYVFTRLIQPAQYLSNNVAYIVIFICITALTIGIAALSYKYYEMPFLRMKSRFSIIHSSNKKD